MFAILKSIKSKMKKGKLNNAGFTMVELIVCFILLAIFMTASTVLISSVIRIYYQAKGTTYGYQVSNIINTKLEEELMSAVGSETEALSDRIRIYDASDVSASSGVRINFQEASGANADLSTALDADGNSYLNLHYYAAGEYEAVDWKFDKAVYMGYSITDLVFSIPDASEGYKDNVVKVELTVTHPRYGSYSTTRYISCYNFSTGES